MDHVIEGCQCEGKKCTKCPEVRCLGYYTKDKRLKSGLKSQCKICASKENKEWIEKNKDYDKKRKDLWFKSEKGRESQRKSDQRPERKARKSMVYQLKREESKEDRMLKRSAWKLKRQEEKELRRPIILKKARERRKRHYIENKEAQASKWASFYEANREYNYNRVRQWQKAHPDGHAAIQARRRARKTQAGGSYTEKEWQDLKAQYHFTCLRCRRKEPDIKLTADHVLPIVLGGTSFIDNIQPLCKSCNSSKHKKHIDFRPKNP